MSRVSRLSVLSAVTLAVVMVVSASPAQAHPAQGDRLSGAARGVHSITDGLAQTIARSLSAPDARQRLLSATSADPADLLTIAPGLSLTEAVRTANRATLAAKGLPASGGSVLQLRLAHPSMQAALARGESPLVASASMDDRAERVVAYDIQGARVLLDASKQPERPVFVVEVDVQKALRLGLSVVRHELAARKVLGSQQVATAASGYWATKVDAVRLRDDKEPWIKGSAEIFSIVGGFGLDGHAKADIVQMPYLNYDGTTYYPNQLLVHFSAYKYNLADVVMMEDDGDTNYQQLATAIANALLTIIDAGAYVPLVNAILGAIPSSWWTDDPDYVDSWYTLSTFSSGRLNGAAANGWMDVSPYWVAPL